MKKVLFFIFAMMMTVGTWAGNCLDGTSWKNEEGAVWSFMDGLIVVDVDGESSVAKYSCSGNRLFFHENGRVYQAGKINWKNKAIVVTYKQRYKKGIDLYNGYGYSGVREITTIFYQTK